MPDRSTGEWWVKRKGHTDLGPLTHSRARSAAKAIAQVLGKAPPIQRRVDGKVVTTITPRFPELAR